MLLNTLNHIDHTNFELIKLNSEINWLNIIAILICVSLIISSKIVSSDSILSIIGLRNEKTQTAKGLPSYFLNLNYFITVTLFIWNYYSTISDGTHFYSFFIILISVIGVSLLKILIIYLIDSLFNRKNHFHIRIHFQFYQLLGVILLPLYVLSYFFEPKNLLVFYLYISILFILVLITREFISLFTALNNRISLLYLILYLCTLELLPVILVIKLFMY
jgi:hypothetical protein